MSAPNRPRDAADCTCYYACGDDSLSEMWRQHGDDPCPVHPDAPMVDGPAPEIAAAKVRLTDLEHAVAQRIGRGEDPWGPRGYNGGSRRVSQAIGRLKRKGVVCENGGYALTPAGRAALASHDKETGR